MLLILTAVDKVYINYNKDNVEAIDVMDSTLARNLIEKGEFAKGSMLPKVEACLDFVENTTNTKAIITSLDKAYDALLGKTGTIIKRR